jgi:predicted RNA-binding Zn-ribbon protein involved in translation (DUF1610 family)
MVVLRKYDNPFRAQIMLTRLRDAGINCYIKDDNAVIVTRPIGGLKLIVSEADEVQARLLLDQFEKESETAILCPNCGGYNLYLVSPEGAGTSITGILSSYFAENTSSTEDMYRCNDCGHETRIPSPEQDES